MAGFQLRYSGCAALDISQMFVKKQGVYCMLHTVSHPSRLSLLYEVVPLGFLIEKAGGKASDATQDVLDIKIKGFHQKVNFIAGSKEDVEYITEEINQDSGNTSGKKGSYNNLLDIQQYEDNFFSSQNDDTKILVVGGGGQIGKIHVKNLKALGAIVGNADFVRNNECVHNYIGKVPYSNPFEEGYKAAIVALPDHLCYKHCKSLIDCGFKKILVESPGGQDGDEMEKLVELAEEKNVTFFINHQR